MFQAYKQNNYRTGAAAALLDIYEQAIADLQQTITRIPEKALTVIADAQTADENCRSLQSILAHVVHAGFGYAASIGCSTGQQTVRRDCMFLTSIQEYAADLRQMFLYTLNIFDALADHDLEQHDNALKIKTGWGQLYDIEQLMEHAIVHVLRHKRQIEHLQARGLCDKQIMIV